VDCGDGQAKERDRTSKRERARGSEREERRKGGEEADFSEFEIHLLRTTVLGESKSERERARKRRGK